MHNDSYKDFGAIQAIYLLTYLIISSVIHFQAKTSYGMKTGKCTMGCWSGMGLSWGLVTDEREGGDEKMLLCGACRLGG